MSIIIPCHNSAKRLPETLAHLARQQVDPYIPWEVIIVDNASTDRTADVAKNNWSLNSLVPLRVVNEPKLGAGPARARGLNEAKFECISVVDDDNWVCQNWVALVFEVMSQNQEVGACGVFSDAVCDGNIPSWFDEFKTAYAIGAWGEAPGDVTHKRAYLWSAGLTIRKTAWNQLHKNRFQPLLSGRKNNDLTCGDDSEICYALRFNGWHWWYEPRLQFQHYLPASRLTWNYLRRLHRGFGASSVILDIYADVAKGKTPPTGGRWIKGVWLRAFAYATKGLIQSKAKLIQSFFLDMEGDSDVLKIESQIGQWKALWQMRRSYETTIAQIYDAPWRKRIE